MSNVITKVALHENKRDQMARLVVVACNAITLSLAVAVIALLPAYIDARAERLSREVELGALTNTTDTKGAGDGQEEGMVLSAASARAKALHIVSEPQKISEAIEIAIATRPKGTRIESFTYAHLEKGGTLDITGKMDDRSLAKGYAEDLKGRALFTDVSVPLSSLVQISEDAFTLTVRGNF